MTDYAPLEITLVDSSDMDDDISASCGIEDYKHISIHTEISNTNAVGVIYLKESNNNSNWVDVELDDGSTSITVSSGIDVSRIDHIQTYAKYFKYFYDRTSGDGTINVVMFAKE